MNDELANGISSPGIDWVKHTRIILTLVSIVVLLCLTAIVLGIYVWDHGLIADGVFLNGVDIGHLTPSAAESKLGKELAQYLNQPVEFRIGNETRSLSLAQLGYAYDLKSSLNRAYAIGRQGGLPEKVADKIKASKGLKLNISGHWNETALRQVLETALSSLNRAPSDASLRLENNEILITPEVPGKETDFSALIATIESLDPNHPQPIQVQWQTTQPSVTSAQLEKLRPNKLLSTYSTRFSPQLENRTHNIFLAAGALNNLLLRPGEEFSFNDRVGARTPDTGYREALIIVNDTFVPGIGGGVCQVSSTLYNAVLIAGLKITERHPHALPVNYVPPGRDATVAYGTLDLKFSNTLQGYLQIRSEVNGDILTFSLYGP